MDSNNQLKKNLLLGPAVGLAITMVVGSGLLVLPGLAYAQVGPAAVYAWLACAVAVGPILVVFSALGARFPNAGGVAGFLQAAFGRPAGMATEILVLGAVTGGAAVAITGGQYFAAVFDGTPLFIFSGTALVLAAGGTVNYLGAKLSGRLQQGLAFILVTLLVLVALTSFAFGGRGGGIAPAQNWPEAIPAFGLVFFAFVGWEMMAFTSEEFKNPGRDFPLMMGISYGVIIVLYALIAVATQLSFQQNDPVLAQAPLAAMLSKAAGPGGGKFVAGVGFVIVLANFIGVVWAFSRLTFSSAREGLLPKALAELDKKESVPTKAVVTVTLIFSLIVLAYFFKLVSQSLLFELAGASFFFSYILAVAAYLKLADSFCKWALGITAMGLSLGLYLSFGEKALYPVVLFVLGLILSRVKKKKA